MGGGKRGPYFFVVVFHKPTAANFMHGNKTKVWGPFLRRPYMYILDKLVPSEAALATCPANHLCVSRPSYSSLQGIALFHEHLFRSNGGVCLLRWKRCPSYHMPCLHV
jgi:hypothetical protein